MTPRTLIDRLSIQISSLQEGFELLSRSNNLKDLARHFFHLVRGNLTTVEGHVFLKNAHSQEWQKLHGKGTAVEDLVGSLAPESAFTVRPLKHTHAKLLAVQPLIDGSCVAVILGRKLTGKGYSELDHLSLQVLLQLFANAHQVLLHRQKEKGLAFSLNHRLLQLNSLIDTGIEFARLQQRSELAKVALERAAALTNASRGVVRVMEGKSVKERIVFPADITMRKRGADLHRIRSGFRFSGISYSFELYDKESRAGAGPFEETDQLLLDALTRQVQATFEIHHLHKQEVEKQKIERDIAVAAEIQQRILPKSLPVIGGYDIAGTNIPTKFVGGDYYDCIPVGNGRYALIMADVAGKGVPAALLVSSFHAYLSAYLETDLTLLDLTNRLNTAIYGASTEERYITAAMALFDPLTGDLECVNAGHTASFVLRNNGAVEELGAGGLALGMLDMEFPFETEKLTLHSGDRLFMYTDGVSEAMDASGKLYDTDEYLKQFALRCRPDSAQGFIVDLLSDINAFVKSAPQADDITAMYLIKG